MSGLGDALERVFTRGVQAPAEEEFTDQLDALKARHGGVSGLARFLGVHRTTVQRWQRGAIRAPKPAIRERIAEVFRAENTPRIVQDNLTLSGTMEPDKGRRRTINVQQLQLAPGTVDRARQAYIETGDKEVAAVVFHRGIRDDFYADFFWDDDLNGYEDYESGLDSDYMATGVSVST